VPAFVLLAFLAFPGPPGTPAPPDVARQTREALLAELQPVVLANCELRRFGSEHDGGYLLCDNLSDGIESAYSYGVGLNDDFGCDVAKRYGVSVHEYDCFDPGRPTCDGGVFVFHDACIGPRQELVDGRVFDTLQNQIAANGDAEKRLIVKMDVEGAEWESLAATPDAVLERIDQLPMELHGVDDPRNLEVLRRLKKHFHLVNLHFNNFACSAASAPLPAWAFQVLLVNKRLGKVDRKAPVPAPHSPLNAPDTGGPDCQLAPPTSAR
jgi:hypothetical protein